MSTDRQVLRGFLANIETIPPLIVRFQFNPSSVKDTRSVKFSEESKLGQDTTGKVQSGVRDISFSLTLHGMEQGLNALNPSGFDNGISSELAKFRSFLYPKEDAWAALPGVASRGKRIPSPPSAIFGFGTKILECFVTGVDINETQFNSYLAPVQATVGISLRVREEKGNALFELDKQHRNALTLVSLQSLWSKG
jgi:Contractile injection system tube protein